MRDLLRSLWRHLPTFPRVDGGGTEVPVDAGGTDVAGRVTPAIEWYAGLGWWAEHLATLDPAAIARMLLELEPPPYDPEMPLVTGDATDGWETLGFPIGRVVRVVELRKVLSHPSGDSELAIGSFVIFDSAEAAAKAMAAHQVLYYGDYDSWPTSLAGLPGTWIASQDGDAELIVLAGPVIMDAVESRTHVAQSVSLVLLNAHHMLHHLWMATRDALDID